MSKKAFTWGLNRDGIKFSKNKQNEDMRITAIWFSRFVAALIFKKTKKIRI